MEDTTAENLHLREQPVNSRRASPERRLTGEVQTRLDEERSAADLAKKERRDERSANMSRRAALKTFKSDKKAS